MEIIDDNFMVCSDCASIVLIGDATALDYHYTEAEANQRLTQIETAIVNTVGSIEAGDSENDLSFSWQSCELCKSHLGGYRYHCVIFAQ
jgi:hypothetical protein